LIMKRKTKQIELFDKRLLLAERDAEDVFAFVKFVEDHEGDQISIVQASFANAFIVSDALKYNLQVLKWWQFLKRWQLKRIIKKEYLLKRLSVQQLAELAEIVIYELEGADKKKLETKAVKKSAETSPGP